MKLFVIGISFRYYSYSSARNKIGSFLVRKNNTRKKNGSHIINKFFLSVIGALRWVLRVVPVVSHLTYKL